MRKKYMINQRNTLVIYIIIYIVEIGMHFYHESLDSLLIDYKPCIRIYG